MTEKKTLKERMESDKKKAKAWWEENKELAILAGVSIDAIVTERFYDAFQHPEKVKRYDDGSFNYVNELEKGD